MTYVDRIVDAELQARLRAMGGVVIEGPRGCGKTSTARQRAVSEVLLDVDESARRAVDVDPNLILEGQTPRLIDEWQIEPRVWNHIRRTIDDRGEPGQFILTGSAVPADDVTRHTGAGRIGRLRMRTMTLFETGHATGQVSLRGLLDGEPVAVEDPKMALPDLAERIAIGGWPGQLGLTPAQSLSASRDYLDEVRRVDIERLSKGSRDPERVGRLLRSLARNVASEATARTLAADTGGADGPLHDETVRSYMDALERLMVVESQPAWSPDLRSRSTLRKSPKRHFVDPSLAVAALRATPDRLLGDLETLGLLFESLVIRDLRVYAQAADARVFHYRDNTGLEVDAVVEAADGQWAAFEVKLGQGRLDEAAATLLKLAGRVDTRSLGEPAALAIVVGQGFGYVRDDGVSVVPVAALGP